MIKIIGKALKKLLLLVIDFYRKYLSPLKSTKCPYYPSCSTYGREAVEYYGALLGGLICLWRILRCNPFSKGGYDPLRKDLFNRKKNKKIKYIYNK